MEATSALAHNGIPGQIMGLTQHFAALVEIAVQRLAGFYLEFREEAPDKALGYPEEDLPAV